jgi:hypothetical protein
MQSRIDGDGHLVTTVYDEKHTERRKLMAWCCPLGLCLMVGRMTIWFSIEEAAAIRVAIEHYQNKEAEPCSTQK